MRVIEYFIAKKSVTIFLALLLGIGGIISYNLLGKLEDPEFKIKEAIIVTLYPGATAEKVEKEVSDKIEFASKQISDVEYVESISKYGYSQVKVKLNESIKSSTVGQHWDELRKKIEDIQLNLPIGVIPSKVFDDYGDVYGIFLALTFDGYKEREMIDYSEFVKKEFERIEGISKIEIFAQPKEEIYLQLKEKKVNVNPKIIISELLKNSLITGSGAIESKNDFLYIDINGKIDSLEKIKNMNIEIIDFEKKPKIVKLKEIFDISKGYNDKNKRFYFNNRKAMGISISPKKGENIIVLGERIERKISEIQKEVPIGIEIEKVYYQPELVSKAIVNFIFNLIISVITVIGVLVVFMGLKSSIIIGVGLILSILGTFIFMIPLNIDLQRVSLGSFIIAMGILVDNSIVIVDGVLAKKSELDVVEKVVKINAIPLLGATMIAVISFLPGALMPTYMGEYIGSSFWVIGISLILSWVCCVSIVPVLSEKYLLNQEIKESKYEKFILEKSRKILNKLIEEKNKVILVILSGMILAIIGFFMMPKTFFPDSDKKGFVVNLWSREGKKQEVVEKAAQKLKEYLLKDKRVKNISLAVGGAPPRYYVATIPEVGSQSYAQLILNVDTVKNIADLNKKINEFSKNLPEVQIGVKKYPNGVPSEYPIEVLVSGKNIDKMRKIGKKIEGVMRESKNILNIKSNWRTPVLSFQSEIDQYSMDKKGVNSLDINIAASIFGDGVPVGIYQKGDKKIPIKIKAKKNDVEKLEQIDVWGVGRKANALGGFLKNPQITFLENNIYRKNRERIVKVQAEIPTYLTADEVRNEIKNKIEKIELPKGYNIRWGGEYEEQMKNIKGLVKYLPITLIFMFTICVFLFSKIRVALLIFGTLPLCLIGIVPGLLITGKNFGFMSIIGLIALIGIMIKNIVVLVDEIKRDIGKDEFEKVVINASISRIRAVSLSAITTIFGMLTLIKDPLYGDMALTIILGLFASTVLTLFIFPIIIVYLYSKFNINLF